MTRNVQCSARPVPAIPLGRPGGNPDTGILEFEPQGAMHIVLSVEPLTAFAMFLQCEHHGAKNLLTHADCAGNVTAGMHARGVNRRLARADVLSLLLHEDRALLQDFIDVAGLGSTCTDTCREAVPDLADTHHPTVDLQALRPRHPHRSSPICPPSHARVATSSLWTVQCLMLCIT